MGEECKGRELGQRVKNESPTPDGMGLLHVFAPPDFMSQSGGGRKAPPRLGTTCDDGSVGRVVASRRCIGGMWRL